MTNKFPDTPGSNGEWCNKVLNSIESRINDDTSKTYFTLSYTEGVVQPNNYDQPLGYFLKTAARVYGSVANTKFINMFWREVEVQTDKGLILENIEHKSTLSIDNIFVDTIDRGNGKARVERGQSVDQSFIEFILYSSNNKLIYVRKYQKIVDVFANIGGISEVIGFIVVFLYAWYNGIRMEQKLLNYGVLNQKDKRTESQISKGQGNENMDWEKKRLFTFGELVKFGLIEKKIGCCFKSKKVMKRMQFYNQVKASFEERTDIISIMKSVSDIDTIKEAILAPHQQRLMQYLALQKDDDETNEKEMSIKEANDQLNNTNIQWTPVQQQVNLYLKEHLPDFILNGNLDQDVNDMESMDKWDINTNQVMPVNDDEKVNVSSKKLLVPLPLNPRSTN